MRSTRNVSIKLAVMEPKVIKTEAQYQAYLAEVERIAADDPVPGTPEGDRLELLAKLVEDYEKGRFPFERPDPISAIRFRMQEQGLRQKDLAPILGGKNRASEVLSRKRPLTLPMVRALSESLHIPAELLIGEPEPAKLDAEAVEEDIPLPYLVKTGWLPRSDTTPLTTRALVQHYLKPAHGPLYLRRTITYGATPETNKSNLRLWISRVRELAAETRRRRGVWRSETLNEEFLRYVAQLSWSEKGPRLAQDFLAEKGVALVILPVLPKTKLDGAAMLDQDSAPVVGMTLRFDRLDSFWFTLMHELAHAWKHLHENDIAITDESVEDERDDSSKEAEANRLARDALIPRALWKRSEAFLHPSSETICAFADKLHISPAIVAGRLRREKIGYGAFGKLVGHRQVRRLFPEVNWE
jgi:HTH-type transcriptional regulator / antitoxin HigA